MPRFRQKLGGNFNTKVFIELSIIYLMLLRSQISGQEFTTIRQASEVYRIWFVFLEQTNRTKIKIKS